MIQKRGRLQLSQGVQKGAVIRNNPLTPAQDLHQSLHIAMGTTRGLILGRYIGADIRNVILVGQRSTEMLD